jgi:CubicO group peptidase (beta-lactamase class C family)
MDRRNFIASALALSLCPMSSDARESAALDKVLKAFGTDNGPGMAVQVLRHGKVVCRRTSGLADLEKRRPVGAGTCFRLASMTKAFTAMAILQLVDRKQIRFDTPLPDIFPDFPGYGRTITVLDLLQHTSGLPDFASLLPEGYTGQVRDDDVLRMLEARDAAAFPPGARFEYSNSGYILLGLAVAKVSGMPFGAFLRKSIFDVAGMNTAIVYDGETTPIAGRAFGYANRDGKYVLNDQSSTSATQGDGGIYASLEDMAGWEAALVRGNLVSPALQSMAFTSGRLSGGAETGYGFGWFVDKVNGHPRYWHGGGTAGFHNHVVRLPESGIAVQVLMNHDDASAELAATELVWQWAPAFRPAEPKIKRLTSMQLDAFEGYYDFRGTLTSIQDRGGKLAWLGLDAKPVMLLPEDAGTFFYESRDINPDRNWRLRFDRVGAVSQISYMVDGRVVFTLPAMGALCSRLTAGQGSAMGHDPFQARVEAWLSGTPDIAAAGLTPPQGLTGKSVRMLEAMPASASIDRNGRMVASIYKFAAGSGTDIRWLVVTADTSGTILSADSPEI